MDMFTGINWSGANWPIVGLGFIGLLFVAGVVILLALYHAPLFRLLKDARKQTFNRETLFWIVNITFMAFSAYHAAPFYSSVSSNVLGMDWFAPFVGITAALVLDALVIVFQNARKRASYKHDRKRIGMYTRYIAACCGLNSVANLYTNYQHFDSQNYSNFWGWAINIAPIFLSLFPLFIVGMSNALEEMSSSSAIDSLDVNRFKQDEEKRVGLLEAQTKYQRREVEADRQLIEIEKMRKDNERMRKGKALKGQRVSRLSAWWWHTPLQQDYVQALETVKQEHQQNVDEVRKDYDAKIVALTEQITSLTATLETSMVANKTRHTSRRPSVTHSDAQASQTSMEVSTSERHTEEIEVIGKNDVESDGENVGGSEQQKPTPLFAKRRGNAALRKVRNILKKHPDIGPTDISKRAGISRSYASQLRDQVLKEA